MQTKIVNEEEQGIGYEGWTQNPKRRIAKHCSDSLPRRRWPSRTDIRWRGQGPTRGKGPRAVVLWGGEIMKIRRTQQIVKMLKTTADTSYTVIERNY